MEFGIGYAASFDAVRQAKLAEELGYVYVGFYDSPALEPDIWITIANAVQATSRIKVGSWVLIPHLRHPMAQASAMATIEGLAPGRLFVGVGTGFTGRMALGQRPLTWAAMRRFLTQVKGLLAGEQVEIEGATTQMIHPAGFAPARPIHIPFLVSANGPKGVAVAREFGAGLIYGGSRGQVPSGFRTLEMVSGGLILEDGETPASRRVLEASRVAFALSYHLAYEGFLGENTRIEQMPYGADWLEALAQHPKDVRHLIVHDQHAVGVGPHDAAFIDRHPDALAAFASQVAVTPEQLRDEINTLGSLGATQITCSPFLGTDWESATRSFAKAVGL